MKTMTLRTITDNALVAATYVVLTLLTASFAYLGIQFRIAEILILLCFFRKDFIYGLCLGTLVANALGPLGFYDVLFGTLATFLSAFLISRMKNLILASLFPVIINGLVVGAELYFLLGVPFWMNAGLVAVGEFAVVSLVGVALFSLLRRNRKFLEAIRAEQNF